MNNIYNSIFFLIIIVLVLSVKVTDACTSGLIASIASADKRPILWKNRDFFLREQRIIHIQGSKYCYLGIGDNVKQLYMGINEKGLALGNTLMSDLNGGKGNATSIDWLLQNAQTVKECRVALKYDLYSGEKPSHSLSIIDATGDAFVVEKGESYYEYDPLVFGEGLFRKNAVIVRTNSAHANENGSDDSITGGDRFWEARDNLQNAVLRDGILNTDMLDYNGITIEEVIKVSRWGNPCFADKNSNWMTINSMIANGVNSGEDPSITVMWCALHKPDYIPFIPVWYQLGAQKEIPVRLTIENNEQSLMFQAERIYNKKDPSDYDQYINRRLEPMEKNFIQAVNNAREKWFRSGFIYSEAKRICTEATETSYLTLKTIADNAEINNRNINKTPELLAINTHAEKNTNSFSSVAYDPDGNICKFFWDFGDGHISYDEKPFHKYEQSGDFLVMCRVVDNRGSSNSIWKYISIDNQNIYKQFFKVIPLAGSATFLVSLPERGQVSLDIYNLNGQHLWNYQSLIQTEGQHTIIWDHKMAGKICIAVLKYMDKSHIVKVLF